MRALNKLFVLFILMVLTVQCIEPFTPEISKYRKRLVVEGMVTNMPGPYEIKLSRSIPYHIDTSWKETKATVRVIDDLGNEYVFTEVDSGIYKSNVNEFQGQAGRSYKLHIETSKGEVYESDYILLKEPVPIDNVFYEIKPIATTDIKGIQFYVDTHDPLNNTHYYSWELAETWEIRVPFNPKDYYNIRTCYRSNTPSTIFIGSTIDNQIDELRNHALLYVNDRTNRLRYRYSLLVKQYSLSEKAYSFYRKMKDMNENTGSLFDPAPYTLEGNVRNMNDNEEIVLGIFQVSSVSSKRVFVSKAELPSDFFSPSEYEYCDLIYVPFIPPVDSITQVTVDSLDDVGYHAVMDTIKLEEADFYVRVTQYDSCFDCTTAGTNIKPDFW